MVYNITFDNDPNFLKLNVTLFTRNENPSTIMNITFDLIKTLSNSYIYYEFNTPESDTDTKYLRQLFRSNIDVSKILQGIRGNFVISWLSDVLLKSFDFEIKFPIRPVRYQYI